MSSTLEGAPTLITVQVIRECVLAALCDDGGDNDNDDDEYDDDRNHSLF